MIIYVHRLARQAAVAVGASSWRFNMIAAAFVQADATESVAWVFFGRTAEESDIYRMSAN